ncbi:MAG: argininosuccinate lyase [Pseudomonadota bacterium]
MKVERLWGSRFKEKPDEEFIKFISGRDIRGLPPCDELLISYDIWGSRAHALMLWKQGIIPREDAQIIIKGLREAERLFNEDQFTLDPAKEDVHTNIESFLIGKYGLAAGGKLHTARSRNDQVTLDMALFLRDKNLEFCKRLLSLEDTIVTLAKAHAMTLIPGYTHHQHAMVTTFGHLLFAYGESLFRDVLRLRHWHTLFNANPLGGAAGYGTSFPIDRVLTSSLLGFQKPSFSSLDLITNRWEAEAELAYAISMVMNHLSGLAQTLILFTTTEFGFVTLSDKYCGGSSIMPQKRNPSALEVMKAKTAVVQGLLGGLFSMSRSFFVGYNRDSQWSKYVIMDVLHETMEAPTIMAAILDTLSINHEKAKELCYQGFITATDLMEAIVNDFALPLRQGKTLIEKAVKYSESQKTEIVSPEGIKQALQEMDLPLDISSDFIRERQEPALVVERRKAIGGPSSEDLERAISELASRLEKQKHWLQDKTDHIQSAKIKLEEMENDLLNQKHA